MTENTKTPLQVNTELIKSDAFENALTEAANVKKETLTSCKDRNKNNYSHFHDVMLMSRKDIQSILDMKKRNRSDEDNAKVKQFKKETSFVYKTICDLIIPEEDLEEGDENKIQKMCKKVASVIKMMNYIGHNEIEDEFKKYGIEFKYQKLDENDCFSNDNIKKDIEMIFDLGKGIKEDINKNNESIKTEIYESAVPIDLQYDKQSNPTGIKNTDFCKLVDLKTKMIMAGEDEDKKEKISDQANTIAGDLEFSNVRNKILQAKLVEIS